MKYLLLALMSVSAIGFSDSEELKLPGAKWLALFNKYVCDNTGKAVARPKALEDLNVVFEQITTDATLDNALIKATYEANGVACNYNVILLADNAKNSVKLVNSKGYSVKGEGSCEDGRKLLDAAFEDNEYLYYGHPHNIAIMLPGVGAEGVCNGATEVGVNFLVKGKIPQNP